jgi:type VII secretion protein EccE
VHLAASSSTVHSGPGRTQLVAVEVALLLVGGAVYAADPVLIGIAAAVALPLLAVSLGRSGGRWWYQAMPARGRLRRRRRAHRRLADQPDPVLATFPASVRIRTATDRGTTIGVGEDDAGWFCALALTPQVVVPGRPWPVLALDRLATASSPVSAFAVVTHYRSGPQGAPAAGQVWLALRLGSWDAADAAARRGGGLAGVDRALAAAIGRIGALLTQADLRHQVLDADGLRQTFATSAGIDHQLARPTSPAQPDLPVTVDERWQGWSSGGLAHACFAVHGWPRQPSSGLLVPLVGTPASMVATTLLAVPGPPLTLRALIRIAAPADHLARSVQTLRENASRLGVRLRRTDGEHAPGAYATSPTAWLPAAPRPPGPWAVATPAPSGWSPVVSAPPAAAPPRPQADR